MELTKPRRLSLRNLCALCGLLGPWGRRAIGRRRSRASSLQRRLSQVPTACSQLRPSVLGRPRVLGVWFPTRAWGVWPPPARTARHCHPPFAPCQQFIGSLRRPLRCGVLSGKLARPYETWAESLAFCVIKSSRYIAVRVSTSSFSLQPYLSNLRAEEVLPAHRNPLD